MAKDTRYYKKVDDAHDQPWEPTEKQKHLVRQWGVTEKYTQEDKYRLNVFLDTIQAGKLDNLETEPGQYLSLIHI